MIKKRKTNFIGAMEHRIISQFLVNLTFLMGEVQTVYLLRMESGLNIHVLARGSTSVKNEVRKVSPTKLYCKSCTLIG